MRIERLNKLGFPDLCPGCAGAPETFYIANLRRLPRSLGGRLLALLLLGHGGHYETFSFHIPVCRACERRAAHGPWLVAGIGLALFLAAIILPQGEEPLFLSRLYAVAFLLGIFGTPVGYFLAAEWTAPVRVVDFGPSSGEVEWIEVKARIAGYAAGPRRIAGPGGELGSIIGASHGRDTGAGQPERARRASP